MAKSQFIEKGNFVSSHASIRSTTHYTLSADEDGGVTILATYDKGKTHIEIDHGLMDCSIPHLIEWLQKQIEKQQRAR